MQTLVNLVDKIKKTKKRHRQILAGIFAILLVYVGGIIWGNTKSADDQGKILGESVPIVDTILAGEFNENDFISVSGMVESDNKINIIAKTSGTVISKNYKVGDRIQPGDIIFEIKNDVVVANYSSASVAYVNSQENFNLTNQLAEQSVLQSSLALDSALENVSGAELSLSSAKDNLANASRLQSNNKADLISNSIVSFYSYLDTAHSAIDKVDYLFGIDTNDQITGISSVLGVLDYSSKNQAIEDYKSARDYYDDMPQANVNEDNIIDYFTWLKELLSLVKTSVDGANISLTNSITSSGFPKSALNRERATYSALRQTIISTQVSVNSTIQSLDNIDLIQKRELDQLASAVSLAENRLRLANIGYDNALANYNSAKSRRDQQIISASISLSATEAQFRIAEDNYNNLFITSPISGVLSYDPFSPGDEVSPGQVAASVNESSFVKVQASLSPEDAGLFSVSDIAFVDDNECVINTIDPIPNAMTRKVAVEIVCDNTSDKFLPETFVDVKLPIKEDSVINRDTQTGLYIPLRAVTIEQTDSYIFIYEDGMASKRRVEIGDVFGREVAITSGLDRGEEVIVSGAGNLSDGDIISHIEKNR